jgi:hypothetical protein
LREKSPRDETEGVEELRLSDVLLGDVRSLEGVSSLSVVTFCDIMTFSPLVVLALLPGVDEFGGEEELTLSDETLLLEIEMLGTSLPFVKGDRVEVIIGVENLSLREKSPRDETEGVEELRLSDVLLGDVGSLEGVSSLSVVTFCDIMTFSPLVVLAFLPGVDEFG